MIESVIVALVRQAAVLTKPQQDEFTTKVAEALVTLLKGTSSEIDDEVVRNVALPLGASLIEKLQAIV